LEKNRISQTFREARRLMSYTEEKLYISCKFSNFGNNKSVVNEMEKFKTPRLTL
jgi:hypothetical protein